LLGLKKVVQGFFAIVYRKTTKEMSDLAYVTYTEYTRFGYKELEKDEFDFYIAKACDYLDSITNNYYLINDIKEDKSKMRVTKFKKACCLMIEFMMATGWGTLSEDGVVDNGNVSWRVGETSYIVSARNTSSTNAELSASNAQVISLDNVYMILSGTGLLCRGLAAINAIGG
jgi:hypothetical protein